MNGYPRPSTPLKNRKRILKAPQLKKNRVEELAERLEQINPIKAEAQACIADTESQLSKVTEDLTTLWEAAAKESTEMVKKRRSLSAQQKTLDKQLSSCKLLLLQSQNLIKSIIELQQGVLMAQ